MLFLLSILVGDSVVDKRVHKVFLISMPNRVTLVDLVELDLINFDVILGMDL